MTVGRGDGVLAPAFADLEDALSDFRNAQFQNAISVLSRFVCLLDEEPLSGFLKAALPVPEFDTWWQKSNSIRGSMVGSGVLNWPVDRSERIVFQIVLCRRIAAEEINFLNFTTNFCYPGSSYLTAHVQKFASTILDPLLRDIRRLAEHRALPPVLFEAMGRLPRSGDSVLDGLLLEACKKFRDPAPVSQQEAVRQLWDAWERLKSLGDTTNKRLSVAALLDRASDDPPFRRLLEEEARALTTIGNGFHIRHFEVDRAAIVQSEHFDYLFHRMYALLHLLLFSTRRGRDA